MTIPATFSDLSTTPASNSPAGSEAIGVIDNNIRTAFAFIGSIYANSGNGWTSPYLPKTGGTVSGDLTVTGATTLSTGVMNVGAGQFYKSAGGDIGIGTAAPGTKLEVASDASSYGDESLRVSKSMAFGGSWGPGVSFYNSHASGLVQIAAIQAFTSGVSVKGGELALSTSDSSGTLAERARFDTNGNFIEVLQVSPPALGVNQQMVANLTSNTNLRISVRGTDGVTRVANITLT